MNKDIIAQKEVRDSILTAIDKIANPIRSTLSPKGSYVILENEVGNRFVTNDGATIAKSISVEDPLEDTIIEIIRDSSLKTNTEAGDGTSTTVLLSSILTKEGLKLVEEGYNRVDVARIIENGAREILDNIDKIKKPVKSDKDLRYIAKVSSNNDEEITENVTDIIKRSGVDGHVVLELGFKDKTEVINDSGFVLEKGLFNSHLKNQQDGRFLAEDVPVLITDKKIYYKEEAQTILKACLDAGHKKVAIVARDFIGEAPNIFIANHSSGNMEVCLIKLDSDDYEEYEDIATYLDGQVVSEKRGKLVDNLKSRDFAMSKRVLSYPNKSIISPASKVNSKLSLRVASLKKGLDDLEKDSQEYNKLKRRISSLTTGLTTVKVGGRTSKEIREKVYRYEDSINAVLSASLYGYLPGAGTSLYQAFKKSNLKDETEKIFRKACESSIRQIAENCDKNPQQILEEIDKKGKNYGYNANTEKVEDMFKAGVVDPYKATVLALTNAVSVALIIIKSKYFILANHVEETNEE